MKNNNKYVVVKIAGKQYRVSEGQEFLVDKLSDPKKINAEVLLLSDGEKIQLGKPVLEKVKASFDVMAEEEKQEKIRVFKYKSKSRYRKTRGFRAKMTRLLLKSIS